MNCPNCGMGTPTSRNFCVHCKHKIRDLRVIKLGKGTRNVRSIERFWETGDPAVFSKPGDPDFNPALV